MIKSDLLLCRKAFQAVFISPGTDFDSEVMKSDGWTYDGYVSKRTGSSHPSIDIVGQVKLCIFPAIYALPRLSVDEGMTLENAGSTVDYDNFIKKVEFVDNSAILVVKAVVIT